MRMGIFAFALWVICNINSFGNPLNKVNFFEGNFEDGLAKAEAEGKYFFVDFYASWCTPCQWMNETTYEDTEIIDLLNKNFISLKINIDDVEGYNWRKKYKVDILPTIMVFDASGKLVERVEETLSVRSMEKLLNKLTSNPNPTPKLHVVNQSPKEIPKTAEKSEEIDLDEVFPPGQKIAYAYSVQVGVFEEYSNTDQMVNNLKSKLSEPILVINDYQGDKVIYRVTVGKFKDKNKAEIFNRKLKSEFNISGFVR